MLPLAGRGDGCDFRPDALICVHEQEAGDGERRKGSCRKRKQRFAGLPVCRRDCTGHDDGADEERPPFLKKRIHKSGIFFRLEPGQLFPTTCTIHGNQHEYLRLQHLYTFIY